MFCPFYGYSTYYVFTTNSSMSVPITLWVNGYSYEIYEANPWGKPGSPGVITLNLAGNDNKWEAVDKDGDRMTQTEKHVKYKDGIPPEERNSSTIEYIRIIIKGTTKLAERGGSSNNNYSNDYPNGSSQNDNRSLSIGEQAAISGVDAIHNIFSNAIANGAGIPHDGFPYFAGQIGYNRFNDFSFGIKFRTGGFVGMFILADCGFMKKTYGLPWDVGVGFCIENFALDMRFGNTDLSPNYGFMVDLSYDWYFYKNWGASFITGIGFGDIEKHDPDMIWNLGMGICYKFWSR